MRTADLHLSILVILLLIFLSVWIAWLGERLLRWLRKQFPAMQPVPAWARRTAMLVSGLNLIYMVGLLAAIATLNQGAFSNGIPPVVVALYTLPLLAAVFTLALIVFTVLVWKNHYWSWPGRVHYSLVTFAALVFLWFLNHWDLLGFRF